MGIYCMSGCQTTSPGPNIQKDNVLYTCQWHLFWNLLQGHFVSLHQLFSHCTLNHVQPKGKERNQNTYFARPHTPWFQAWSLERFNSTVGPKIGTQPLGKVHQVPGTLPTESLVTISLSLTEVIQMLLQTPTFSIKFTEWCNFQANMAFTIFLFLSAVFGLCYGGLTLHCSFYQ